jgi:tetratricopeptide (TPR) repeat protein
MNVDGASGEKCLPMRGLCMTVFEEIPWSDMEAGLDTLIKWKLIDGFLIVDAGASEFCSKIVDYLERAELEGTLAKAYPQSTVIEARNFALVKAATSFRRILLWEPGESLTVHGDGFTEEALGAWIQRVDKEDGVEVVHLLSGTANISTARPFFINPGAPLKWMGLTGFHNYIAPTEEGRNVSQEMGPEWLRITPYNPRLAEAEMKENAVKAAQKYMDALGAQMVPTELFFMARAYYDSGQWGIAKELFKARAVMIGSVDEIYVALVLVGKMGYETNQQGEALEFWQKAYEVDTTRSEAPFFLGALAVQQNRFKIAHHWLSVAAATKVEDNVGKLMFDRSTTKRALLDKLEAALAEASQKKKEGANS